MNSPAIPDLLDRLLLDAGGPVQQLRQARAKVVSATQGSYETLFDPDLPGNLSPEERLLVAWYACLLTPHGPLAAIIASCCTWNPGYWRRLKRMRCTHWGNLGWRRSWGLPAPWCWTRLQVIAQPLSNCWRRGWHRWMWSRWGS